MVCGPVGLGASPKVRPTSVDHPSESEYLSEAVFIFDCFKDSRIFRLRLPFSYRGSWQPWDSRLRWVLMYSMTSLRRALFME